MDTSRNAATPDASAENSLRPLKQLIFIGTEHIREALQELQEPAQTLLPQFGKEVGNKHDLVTINVTVLSSLFQGVDQFWPETTRHSHVPCPTLREGTHKNGTLSTPTATSRRIRPRSRAAQARAR